MPKPSWALAGLGLVLLGIPSGPALAFGQAPLTLAERRGVLQLTNPDRRNLQLDLQVFAVVQQQGRASAELTPLPPEQAEQVIRLRPTHVRLSPGASRTIPYTVLDPNRDFFLCGVSLQGLFTVRVCSRWRALPSASSAAALAS